jgi:hypothetical protein
MGSMMEAEMMKKNQAKIILLDDLQKARREREEQLDNLICEIEGIAQGLDATAEGISFEMGRVFLIGALQNRLAVLRTVVLPEA